ncbi:threonine--tRNA ligase [Patescibacteria group bacterium]|nr:threonine--tRNA ligase [Patescibacteria group bacterium]
MEKENNKLDAMRHSASHIMALAVKSLFAKDGKVKFGIGPTIEDGFYYDFELHRPLVLQDLLKIEKLMKNLISQNLGFKQEKVSVADAKIMFKDQPYKLELISDLAKDGEKNVSIYFSGDFMDLCAGPHVKSSKEIKAFKLTKIAGAYWRGDEKNTQLQRIYGVAFENENKLNEYLERQKQAEERDHRKIGTDLDLFSVSEQFGAGLILWHPNGALIRQQIEKFVLGEYQSKGYQLVMTPHIANLNLFKTSGHWNFYREGMYSPMDIDNEQYVTKPMNCPGHVLIYKTKQRSYRELPIRYTELGTVYRYERSGTLHGLTRVRGFTQDDAHIICTPKQLEPELVDVIKLTKFILETFGFKDFDVNLSVRDPKNKKKYLGNDKQWELAEKALANSIKKVGWKHKIDEGEAVFYGPKMDIKVKDTIGREWQISTLQVDFNLPERFKMEYIDEKGKKTQPFMLHRALLGSVERFMGVLIEHYAGAFPVWLSPVQVQIIPVGADFVKLSNELADELKSNGIRVFVDDLNETVGNKIRKAEKQKVPYMLVMGEKEAKSKDLNVRVRGVKEVKTISKSKFIKDILEQIEKRK